MSKVGQLFTAAELSSLDREFRRVFLNQLSGYRSVHLLGTYSPDGVANLATISQVVHVGAEPFLLGVLFRPETAKNHSLSYIRQRGFFTLNAVTEAMVPQAHAASASFAKEESEFSATGLTVHTFEGLDAPAVAESPIQLGLKLVRMLPIEENGTTLVIGSVEVLNLALSLLPNADGYLPVAQATLSVVSGLDSYHTPGQGVRYAYPKPHQPMKRK